jgi:hypothetical protein
MLRAAEFYPSIKRASVIKEIKTGTLPAALPEEGGLKEMKKCSSLYGCGGGGVHQWNGITEFRQNRDMQEGKELNARVEEALTVMHQLERYGGSAKDQMDAGSHKWHYAMKVPEQR